jgi:hypothetical protein
MKQTLTSWPVHMAPLPDLRPRNEGKLRIIIHSLVVSCPNYCPNRASLLRYVAICHAAE